MFLSVCLYWCYFFLVKYFNPILRELFLYNVLRGKGLLAPMFYAGRGYLPQCFTREGATCLLLQLFK